jgi:hypothetical protein
MRQSRIDMVEIEWSAISPLGRYLRSPVNAGLRQL